MKGFECRTTNRSVPLDEDRVAAKRAKPTRTKLDRKGKRQSSVSSATPRPHRSTNEFSQTNQPEFEKNISWTPRDRNIKISTNQEPIKLGKKKKNPPKPVWEQEVDKINIIDYDVIIRCTLLELNIQRWLRIIWHILVEKVFNQYLSDSKQQSNKLYHIVYSSFL